jgi:uncharacterized membrane protein YkvA (DUF1232 family)
MRLRNLEKRTWQVFRTRFLKKAEAPEAETQIESELSTKLSRLGPDESRQGRLRQVVEQATELWHKRSQLRKTDVLYLAAALLYFISPLDAVPDVLPGIGYLDDIVVVSAVVGLIVRGLSALGTHGKVRIEEWIDERAEQVLEKVDEAAAGGVQKTAAAVAVGLWGTTTAAAVSLAVAATLGGYSSTWIAYVMLSAGIVLACNIGTAVYYWKVYRSLDGAWQERLRAIVVSKLSTRQLLALGVPIVILIGLGICRAFGVF